MVTSMLDLGFLVQNQNIILLMVGLIKYYVEVTKVYLVDIILYKMEILILLQVLAIKLLADIGV